MQFILLKIHHFQKWMFFLMKQFKILIVEISVIFDGILEKSVTFFTTLNAGNLSGSLLSPRPHKVNTL